MKRLIIIAAALVVVANAAVFAHIAYNRSGEPRVITLTERELPLPYYYYRNRSENSGLSFNIDWQVAGQDANTHYYGRTTSLKVSSEKLRELGFSEPDACGGATKERGGRDKSRKVWAVLEYDGPAHAQFIKALEKVLAQRTGEIGMVEAQQEKNELQRIKDQLQAVREYDSRLYVIDLSPDKASLEKRYSEDHRKLILAAEIYNSSHCDKSIEKLSVTIQQLLPASINIPRQFHAGLENLTGLESRNADHPPRYRAKIAIGKLNEPWLLAVEEFSGSRQGR